MCGVVGLASRSPVEFPAASLAGEALFDVHPSGVALDELFGAGRRVVGDDDGGGSVAEAGDDELAYRSRVGRQRGRLVDDLGAPVGTVAVEGDGAPRAGVNGGDVALQAPVSACAG